jgi:putative DNA primase/helicase
MTEKMDKLGVDDFFAAGGDGASLETAAVPFEQWLEEAQDDEPEVGLVKELADAISESASFAQNPGAKLYRFAGGVYQPHGAEFVRKAVKDLLEARNQTGAWSSHLANEVVEYLRVSAPLLWEQPPLDIVNVQNGLLHVLTGVLTPHHPSHLSPIQLPVRFDPAATCPAWERFVAEVFPEDAQDLAWEIPGYLMVPDTAIQQAILLLGDGGNGKSTFLRAVSAFLGRANVSSLSLHKLESDRFAVARLLGKLANVAADLPSEHLTGTSVFKALTGGDELTGEYKYVDSFDFRPFARLVFSANHAPHSGDSSQGFFDRWVVVPFAHTFRDTAEEIPRPVLDARLADPRELSGVLNRALLGLAAVRARHGFTDAASLRDAAAEFRETTDPVAVWLDRATVAQPEAVVLKSALYHAYADTMRKDGITPLTANAFGRALGRLRPGMRDGQRTVAGKLQWVWLGIGLVADAPSGAPGGTTDSGAAGNGADGEANGSRYSRDSRDSISVIAAPTASEFRRYGEGGEDEKAVPRITVVQSRESRERRDEPAGERDSDADPDGADAAWEEGEL